MNLLMQILFIVAVTCILFAVIGVIEKVIARREKRNRLIKDEPEPDTRNWSQDYMRSIRS